jgi:Protein of unknown function (DUF3152)
VPAEAAPTSTVAVVVDPLGTLLPSRPPPAHARESASSCLLDPEPRRACRAPVPGRLVLVPGHSRRSDRGSALRYQVQVETGLGLDSRAVAAEIDRILADPRGWSGGGIAFRRVTRAPVDFRVVLAAPATVDRLCSPLRTYGALSCATDTRAVLNVVRWRRGAPAFHRDVALYRRYLVNHEVGHLLGHGHSSCQAAGARAPVMMQQTMGVGACRANGRPLPWERG